jgi:hypothetical protein
MGSCWKARHGLRMAQTHEERPCQSQYSQEAASHRTARVGCASICPLFAAPLVRHKNRSPCGRLDPVQDHGLVFLVSRHDRTSTRRGIGSWRHSHHLGGHNFGHSQEIKKEVAIPDDCKQLSSNGIVVSAAGLEPATHALKGGIGPVAQDQKLRETKIHGNQRKRTAGDIQFQTVPH